MPAGECEYGPGNTCIGDDDKASVPLGLEQARERVIHLQWSAHMKILKHQWLQVYISTRSLTVYKAMAILVAGARQAGWASGPVGRPTWRWHSSHRWISFALTQQSNGGVKLVFFPMPISLSHRLNSEQKRWLPKRSNHWGHWMKNKYESEVF